MSALPQTKLSPFANDVRNGLSATTKSLPGTYRMDAVGQHLLEAAHLLPEQGSMQAEERILRRHAEEIIQTAGPFSLLVDLGAGNPAARMHLRRCTLAGQPAEDACSQPASFESVCPRPMGCQAEWFAEVRRSIEESQTRHRLFLLLGPALGTMDGSAIQSFLYRIRTLLPVGDAILFGVDLATDATTVRAAYDDPAGIVAALNKNILGRINRELGGHFDLRQFDYATHWNAFLKRIELSLVSRVDQQVYISALGARYGFEAGESIQIELAHKFSELEISGIAEKAGFCSVQTWTDLEWGYEEVLLMA